MNKKLMTAILCVYGMSTSPVTWAGFFPEAGVDSAPSLGKFVVTFTANFVRAQTKLQNLGLCTESDPSICPDEKRTIQSPLLSESRTEVGRSRPHKDSNSGTSTDKRGAWVCQKGTWDNCEEFFSTRVRDSDFVEALFPPLTPKGYYSEDGPEGTEEVHTQMLSLDMKKGANAVKAGAALGADAPRSLGEVQSLNPPDSNGGFPAQSFFNLNAEVDMDIDFDGQVDFTLYNKENEPLVVLGTGLTKFPPKLVYTHTATEWAVPVYDKNGGNSTVAYLRMAGHGINMTCAQCDTRQGQRETRSDDLAFFMNKFERLPVAAINPDNRAIKEFDPEIPTDILGPDAIELCRLYAIQDHERNNGQLFAITPETLYVEPISKVYPGSDFEALTAHPDNDMLYLTSSNDSSARPGYLYRFDINLGQLIEIGDTGFEDVPSLSFHSDGTLWGWAKGKGLITINIETGQGSLVKEFQGILIEDMTWNNTDTHIYASENNNLWVYEQATQTAKLACNNLPGETEALEMLPDGTLLLGIHGEEKIIQFQGINVETCEIIFGIDIPTSPTINDIEGIAWPINACN